MAVECSRLQARIESVPERGPFISKPGNGASSQRRRIRRRRMSYRATKRLIRVPISGPPVPDPGMHAPSNISDLTIADYWMQIDSRVAAGIRRLSSFESVLQLHDRCSYRATSRLVFSKVRSSFCELLAFVENEDVIGNFWHELVRPERELCSLDY